MLIITNELKSAKLLRSGGIPSKQSETIVSMIVSMEIHNIYSKGEVDAMLSESVEKIFAKQDEKLLEQRREFDKIFDKQDEKLLEQRREFDKIFDKQDEKLLEQRREFDAKMQSQYREIDKRLAVEQAERDRAYGDLVSSRRWLTGTIITVGMGLAAYLSALIKLSH